MPYSARSPHSFPPEHHSVSPLGSCQIQSRREGQDSSQTAFRLSVSAHRACQSPFFFVSFLKTPSGTERHRDDIVNGIGSEEAEADEREDR